MTSSNPVGFVPSISTRSLLRRPRSNACSCRPRVLHTNRPQPATMQAGSNEPELSPQSDVDITSTKGFALRDAVVYDFADLTQSQSKFEVPGAYAICDGVGELHYMGYSKNIAAKLNFHQRLVPNKCSSFRLYVPPVPPELISPEMLENVLEYWVRENGSVPRGNTVDRALWENQNSADRKKDADPTSTNSTSEEDDDIPIRERSTSRRVASRRESAQYYSPDPFADTFRSSTGAGTSRRRKESNGWTASEDDYIEVDVDPLDPFSASKRRRATRTSWDSTDDDDEIQEDWFPILALMGVAGLIWFIGLLGNALPAATPSLGM